MLSVRDQAAENARKHLSDSTGLNWTVEKSEEGSYYFSLVTVMKGNLGTLNDLLKKANIDYVPQNHYSTTRGMKEGETYISVRLDHPLEVEAMLNGIFQIPKISDKELSEVVTKLEQLTGVAWKASGQTISLAKRLQIEASDYVEAQENFCKELASLGIKYFPGITATVRGLWNTGFAWIDFATFTHPLGILELNKLQPEKINTKEQKAEP